MYDPCFKCYYSCFLLDDTWKQFTVYDLKEMLTCFTEMHLYTKNIEINL
jgi:hypothetical protein